MSSKIKFALAAGVALVALTGPVKAEDVKIGFVGDITGPIESMAGAIVKGAELALQQVNDAGGVLGGKKLVMSVYDTTCVDPTKATDAADRAVNVDKVAVIVGALCSGSSIAAANNVAVPAGVAMISPASTSPALTTLDDKDLVFRAVASDATQGPALVKMMQAKGAKNIAITYVNNDYGKGFAESVSSAAKEAGLAVAASQAHEDGKADYRSEIGALAGSGADALVVLAYADGSGKTILTQASEGGDFKLFFGGDGMVSDKLAGDLGDKVNGKLFMTKPGQEPSPSSDLFTKAANDAKIDMSGAFVSNSYDAAFIEALAIEKAGSADRAAIAKAIRDVASAPGEVIRPGEWKKAAELIKAGTDINYEGAAGTQDFDKNGDVAGVYYMIEVEGGKVMQKDLIK